MLWEYLIIFHMWHPKIILVKLCHHARLLSFHYFIWIGFFRASFLHIQTFFCIFPRVYAILYSTHTKLLQKEISQGMGVALRCWRKVLKLGSHEYYKALETTKPYFKGTWSQFHLSSSTKVDSSYFNLQNIFSLNKRYKVWSPPILKTN